MPAGSQYYGRTDPVSGCARPPSSGSFGLLNGVLLEWRCFNDPCIATETVVDLACEERLRRLATNTKTQMGANAMQFGHLA